MTTAAPAQVPVVPASDSPDDERVATSIATRFELPLSSGIGGNLPGALTLVAGADEVRLVSSAGRRPAVVRADFLAGASGFRARTPGTFRQPIARACGLHKKLRRIVDVTAGLCGDAAHFAALGANVVALERNPIISALVEDGLRRAHARTEHLSDHWLRRLEFHHADAREWLGEFGPGVAPEVVYIDPMFPRDAASGQSKKEMALTRFVVGDDADGIELLEIALGVASHRVVVKRPDRADPLGGRPTFHLGGKAVRYDVYVAAGSSSA